MLATTEAAQPQPGNVMSLERVGLLMALSFSLYFPYWMYRTWRQYCQHTGHRGYPVWHGLAWLVPIYGFCRFYAHGAAYRHLLDERNLPHIISPSGYIVVLIMAATLGSVGAVIISTDSGTPIPGLPYALMGAAIAMAASVAMMLQHHINRYWQHAGDGLEQNARLGKGEVIVVAVGILIWAAHIAIAKAAT